ncbi:hypothetical protein IT570_03435 [Candidatus Sumerlaeota bacterium]|nr:hypothetical protein [Candidatus Sumerlaeota bacterium]
MIGLLIYIAFIKFCGLLGALLMLWDDMGKPEPRRLQVGGWGHSPVAVVDLPGSQSADQ